MVSATERLYCKSFILGAVSKESKRLKTCYTLRNVALIFRKIFGLTVYRTDLSITLYATNVIIFDNIVQLESTTDCWNDELLDMKAT